jgi:hypothetical protein
VSALRATPAAMLALAAIAAAYAAKITGTVR